MSQKTNNTRQAARAQAENISYELHSLGWKAFQNLCALIVQEKWDPAAQIFSPSHDGGRDIAFTITDSNQNTDIPNNSIAQCKASSVQAKSLTFSDIKSEIPKIKKLANNTPIDDYFIFTNAKLTGIAENKIRKEILKIQNVKRCKIFGREWISEEIRKSPKLRRSVPRLYGLGDLKTIFDERAYSQASDILSSLGDDLDKFVRTSSYIESEKALSDHGFIILLGDPMCGKSTIAATLSLGALDFWGCQTIKARNADDFKDAYNPDEKQLFWVDDAFGSTQLDQRAVEDWNLTFPLVASALRRGTKIIFTSRNYIFDGAKNTLKLSILPFSVDAQDAQVVIDVKDITKDEKQQILYNHLKLGNQPRQYKSALKTHCKDIAAHKDFSPEIARRISDKSFTKELKIERQHIANFIENPIEMLCEVIRQLDGVSRSALGLVFIRNGLLAIPATANDDEKIILEKLGGNVGKISSNLSTLEKSFLLRIKKDGNHFWQFKHPTIKDAYAKIIAETPDLIDVYITGTPFEELAYEISCGEVDMEGINLIVPHNQFSKIIQKINDFKNSDFDDRNEESFWFDTKESIIYRFLANRCNKVFLEQFLSANSNFIEETSLSTTSYNAKLRFIVKLNENNLLPEQKRKYLADSIKEIILDGVDESYLKKEFLSVFTKDEFAETLILLEKELPQKLEDELYEQTTQYDINAEEIEDPEYHFSGIISTLSAYQYLFEENSISTKNINDTLLAAESTLEELTNKYQKKLIELEWRDECGDAETYSHENTNHTVSLADTERSIFDDVDQ